MPSFVLLLLLVYVVGFIGLLLATGGNATQAMESVSTGQMQQIAQTLAAVGASWFFCRVVERRSWLDLGFRLGDGGLRLGLQGWAVGGGMQLLVVVLGLISGAYAVTYNWGEHGSTSQWLLYFVTMAFVGFSEEALLRGYLLQTLEQAAGKWPAALITAALFSALHLANPGAGWGSMLGITVFGLFAAYTVFATRSMWLAIGMHMMWNVFEGVVWGPPNSGNPVPYSIFITGAHGPAWWTGGNFGPEAGLLSTLALVAGIFAVRWQQRRAV